MGGDVEVVSVYRTGLPEGGDVEKIRTMLVRKQVDAVTFTSSSTVTHLAKMLDSADLPGLLDGMIVASIGPVTSGTLRDNGLPVHVEALEYTVDGLVQALAKYFRPN